MLILDRVLSLQVCRFANGAFGFGTEHFFRIAWVETRNEVKQLSGMDSWAASIPGPALTEQLAGRNCMYSFVAMHSHCAGRLIERTEPDWALTGASGTAHFGTVG